MKHLIEKDIQKWHDMSKEYIEKTEKWRLIAGDGVK